MRYTDGTEDNGITAIVRTDGVDCPELGRSSAGSASQCWITVKSGQALTVFCDFKLAASQYQIDCVIDGVLRNIVVSTVSPKATVRSQIVEFYEGIRKFNRSLFRTPMITSRIQESEDPTIYNNSDSTRVGTIEILVYKYDMNYNHHRAAELPELVIEWNDLEGQPGCAGIEPTHEIVLAMDNPKRLNDNERRTWKNKSDKLPMGRSPWASFKFLYRHETSLRGAALTEVPDAERSEVITKFNTKNPWRLREKNGIREYKRLDMIPDRPGPQVAKNKGKRRNDKRFRDSERGMKSKYFVSSGSEDSDTDSANDAENVRRPKRIKPWEESDKEESDTDIPNMPDEAIVGRLRADIMALQLARNQAHRQLEEQSKAKRTKLDLEQEYRVLRAQKKALECEIDYVKLEALKYKERHVEAEGQDNADNTTDAAEDAVSVATFVMPPDDQRTPGSAVEEPVNEDDGLDTGSVSPSSTDPAEASNSGIAEGLVAAMLAHPFRDMFTRRAL